MKPPSAFRSALRACSFDLVLMVVAIVLLVLLFSGCANKPVEGDLPTNNTNVPVDLLFERDGCRMYRFFDAGHYRYFVTCERSSASVSWQYTQCQSNGKSRSCHVHSDDIQTVVVSRE